MLKKVTVENKVAPYFPDMVYYCVTCRNRYIIEDITNHTLK